jgi:two-component sensor histidine kinase
MSLDPSRGLPKETDLPSPVARLLARYVGKAEPHSIEYWQRYVFYVITFAGIIAGTCCVVPVIAWLASTGRPYGWALVAPYALDVSLILAPGPSIRAKTWAIASTFSALGVFALSLAGPEGESGIWFSVSVLILSLFCGFLPALAMASANLAIEMAFAVLHSRGIIGWDVLRNFRFFSWVVQGANIFFMDLTFATANAMLIRGVGDSFRSLKAAESRMREFVAEKETLIRELYHRSKNNMQVVTSILALSSGKIDDEAARAVLKDVINKIGAMSLVHQKLYESKDLSNISMSDYIGELAGLLVASFGLKAGKVELGLDLEELSLQVDTAIPCGLVINEIVTNSLKYAFPGERRGRISISMRASGSDRVELRVADDGVGVAPGFVPSADRKMGMATIFTIATHQLHGTIELDTRAGLAFTISFPRRLYEDRVNIDG